MTPRMLFALLEVHNRLNSIDDDSDGQKKNKQVNMDDVPRLTLEELLAMK